MQNTIARGGNDAEEQNEKEGKKGKEKEEKEKRESDFFVNVWHTFIDNFILT